MCYLAGTVRWRLAALVAAAGCVAAAGLLQLTRFPRKCEDLATPTKRRSVDHDVDSPLAGQGGPRVGVPLEASWFHGRVVDASFGTPVVATVSTDAQPITSSHPRTGEFRVSKTHAAGQVTIAAAGFEAHEGLESVASDGDGTPLEIELTPLRSVSVELFDGSGAALAGYRLRVSARGAENSKSESTNTVQGVTDTDGRWICPTAVPVDIDVLDSDQRVLYSASARPGDTVTVALGQLSFEVVLEAELTATRLPDVAVKHWSPDHLNARAIEQRTDDEGRVELRSPSLPLLVQVGQGEVSVMDELPRGTEWVSNSRVLVSDLRGARPLTLRLRRSGVFLRLRDAASGEPIEGPVVADSLFECRDGSRTTRPLSDPVWIEDGMFLLSERGVEVSRPEHPPFVLAAQGYAPERVVHEQLDLSLTARQARILDLVPSDSQISIRLLDYEGEAVRSRFHVFESVCDYPWFSFEGDSDEAGVLGPFDWQGGDLEIRTGMGVPVTRLGREALEPLTTTTVRVFDPRGSILVHDVADPSLRILALAKSGVLHDGQWTESGELEFLDLPAGEYLIGPPRWIEGLYTSWHEVASELGLEVRDGRRTSIGWNRRWSLTETLGGRVFCNCSGPGDLHLIPVYADQTPGVKITQGGVQAISLSGSGEYTLESPDPRPHSLLVCAADHLSGEGGWRALGQLEPGQSLQLQHREMRLVWAGEVVGTLASVSYKIDPEGLGITVPLASPTSLTMWDTRVPLHLRHVPRSVQELSVRIGGGQVQVHPLPLPPPSTELATIEVGG